MPSFTALLGSLLLVSNRPLTIRQLADITGSEHAAVRDTLVALSQTMNTLDGGVKIIENGDEYQMVSDPQAASVVESFLHAELLGDLTRPQLETLTIIAYRGPVTKSDIELIRGVHSGIVLRNLLMRGLVAERTSAAGFLQYDVSMDTVRYLGLTRRDELPEFEELSTHPLISAVAESAALPAATQEPAALGTSAEVLKHPVSFPSV